MEAAYIFRPYKAEDIPFIQSSWGHSYYNDIDYKYLIGPEEFHRFHRPIRERFFLRNGSQVIICCAKDNHDLIMAWVAVERPKLTELTIIHYIYVKEAFKGESLANALIEHLNLDRDTLFTHMTGKLKLILKSDYNKYQYLTYAPHLI